MVKLNLKTLNLQNKESNSNQESAEIQNGEVTVFGLDKDKVKTVQLSDAEFFSKYFNRLFCSYGEFFIVKDDIYYGVNYKETENGEIHPTSFNGKMLTQAEMNSRKNK